MKYAVIKISGKQFKVHEGQEIIIDRVEKEKLEPEVLLLSSENKTLIGKPNVKNAKIKIKVLKEEKGKKVNVLRYKAKSRYIKRKGFRPVFTRILIEKIPD